VCIDIQYKNRREITPSTSANLIGVLWQLSSRTPWNIKIEERLHQVPQLTWSEYYDSYQVERHEISVQLQWHTFWYTPTGMDSPQDSDHNAIWHCLPKESAHVAGRYWNLWNTIYLFVKRSHRSITHKVQNIAENINTPILIMFKILASHSKLISILAVILQSLGVT